MKKIVFFFGLFFSLFLLAPTPSLATCDFTVKKLSVCYNSRRLTGWKDKFNNLCYLGNWRIRSAIFNIGDTKGTGMYQWLGDNTYTYPLFAGGDETGLIIPGGRLDTNNTVSGELCGSFSIAVRCRFDQNEQNGIIFTPIAKNIPSCK